MIPSGNPIRFVRTTAIGGLLFLLPMIVVGALIGQLVPIVLTLARFLGAFIPVETPEEIAFVVLLAMGVVLLLCFCAGILAHGPYCRSISEAFENRLMVLFPRYAILKDQMADRFGGTRTKPQMKPVLVRFDDCMRMGFETERYEDAELVAVYMPGSPDPWSGNVALIRDDRVQRLTVDFGTAVGTCEQLGRGSAVLLESSTVSRGHHDRVADTVGGAISPVSRQAISPRRVA